MMDYRIFTPKDRMEQLITTNYRLLNMLSRFGIVKISFFKNFMDMILPPVHPYGCAYTHIICPL